MPPDAQGYGWLADAVLVLHAFYVLFVVGGLLLILAGWIRGWAWTRGQWFRLLHLAAIGFVVLEAWFGVPCPLTVLESRLRVFSGTDGYATSFIGYWLSKLIFHDAPPWAFTVVYTAFAVLVVAVFVFHPPRRSFKARH
jgi:hypothetical protein